MYTGVYVVSGSLDAIRIGRAKERIQPRERTGVDFPTAALIFDDLYAMTIRDVLHDEEEERTAPLANLAQARFSLLFTDCSRMKREKKWFG
jgi:uncharacterized DUF497 family protein